MKAKAKARFQCILFDLDETLYPRQAGLMQAISERIILYLTQKLGIPLDDAFEKKRDLYQRYGTSLRGLMVEYRVDPLEYLNFVHAVNPAEFLGASPPLDAMLGAIPLRKVIFTNADTAHAERVLHTLQVRPHFERIIDIRALDYINKPDPLAYRKILDFLGVSGENCVMVEDTARNLIPAKDAGMTTILVDGGGKTAAIDFTVPTVLHIGSILKSFLLTEDQ